MGWWKPAAVKNILELMYEGGHHAAYAASKLRGMFFTALAAESEASFTNLANADAATITEGQKVLLRDLADLARHFYDAFEADGAMRASLKPAIEAGGLELPQEPGANQMQQTAE